MVLREITGTVDGFTYPPHTYELNKEGKLVAFTSVNGVRTEFETPMKFYKKGRKFQNLG